jgi:alkylation response protein AidB-like acyl-CoA dehydrogenase
VTEARFASACCQRPVRRSLAPVYEAGTPEQIRRFVAPFLADQGAPVAAMAFSEPEGTANFAAPPPAEGLRTTAVPDGDSWVVNGRKAWASHLAGWDGDGPDVMTIVCRAPGGVSSSPPPPAPGSVPHPRIQPAQRLWNGLSPGSLPHRRV